MQIALNTALLLIDAGLHGEFATVTTTDEMPRAVEQRTESAR